MGVSKAADHQDDLVNKINSAKANSEITTQTETYSRDGELRPEFNAFHIA